MNKSTILLSILFMGLSIANEFRTSNTNPRLTYDDLKLIRKIQDPSNKILSLAGTPPTLLEQTIKNYQKKYIIDELSSWKKREVAIITATLLNVLNILNMAAIKPHIKPQDEQKLSDLECLGIATLPINLVLLLIIENNISDLQKKQDLLNLRTYHGPFNEISAVLEEKYSKELGELRQTVAKKDN